MKGLAIVLSIAGLSVLSAGAFAADRLLAVRSARSEREEAESQLKTAVSLISRYPSAFGRRTTGAEEASLKSIAQESASRGGVTIGYLAENEREAEKGRHERQLIIRLVNAPHSHLILFLEDLEKQGAGAWIKEIHVRPSREIPDAYEDAEVVLSRSGPASPEKKP